MFIKVFYKILKLLVYVYIILAGIAFIYAIMNLRTIDSMIVGIIFIAGTTVGLYLIKYYGNAIVSFKIESEDIIFTNAKQISTRVEKDKCTAIIHKPSKIIIEFIDEKKYYINKFYFFNKTFFDFSVFNNDNFKNASIL